MFPKVNAVIDKIIEEARTGEIGDGKIFGRDIHSYSFLVILSSG